MRRLTITSDPGASIYVSGQTDTDAWLIETCAFGDGSDKDEARDRLSCIGFSHRDGVFHVARNLLASAPIADIGRCGAEIAVTGPADGSVLVHASYCYVHVRDIGGPVRVSAAHARVSLLDTSGDVDAVGFCIDMVFTTGQALLSTEAGINLKLREGFAGTVRASTQGSVHVRIPTNFRTPFRAFVPRADNFICRAGICDQVRRAGSGSQYSFTYVPSGVPDDQIPVNLSSEQSTVVIDRVEE